MIALLVCRSRSCRASFEAEGSRQAIAELTCADCGGPLKAVGWADAEGAREGYKRPQLQRRAA